jgi:MoxR-like ATPase
VSPDAVATVVRGRAVLDSLLRNLERAIVGKRPVIELSAAVLAASGHLLLTDVPGVGKTVLGRAMARSIGGTFTRIQCTPDLLPSDITGGMIFDSSGGGFRFVPGPIFANVVLADELNRTTPRTQAAFLEAMDEGQVTADGTAHPLPRPFFLIATLNPLEHHGTYPLPEGELDRFLASASLGYLTVAEEAEMVTSHQRGHPIDRLRAVTEPAELLEVQEAVRGVRVDPSLTTYAVEIVAATRDQSDVLIGGSPRASLGLVRLAQARALLLGRDFVLPDDVKELASAVLPHRLVMRGGGDAARIVVQEILAHVPVPVAPR